MLLALIEDATPVRRNIKSKTDGREFTFTEQEVWIYGVNREGRQDPHPYKTRLTLDKDQAPYAPGTYTVAPASLRFDNFGRAAQTGLRLMPIQAFLDLLKATVFRGVEKA